MVPDPPSGGFMVRRAFRHDVYPGCGGFMVWRALRDNLFPRAEIMLR